MGLRILRYLIVVGAILASPIAARAQEATLSGAITDTTGGALPGVTITATHEASGNVFTAATDARGEYRMPLRVGTYRLTVELSGFNTVNRTGLELLLGQLAVVNLQMAPAGVQESLTVTAEAPLIDTSQSKLGGNIDPRQLQELPINGRNWMDLTQLAPGSRSNAGSGSQGDDPLPRGNGTYQLNVDGQGITNSLVFSFGQAHFSRDAIGEFEYVSNRFDALQGRSSGIQVNAITKSGTNTISGSFAGYFRADTFNAAEPISKRVLPYSDQQVSGTFGGPIKKDRAHYFVNYDYEREPRTFVFSTPYPAFNQDISDIHVDKKGLVRLDFQLSSQTRLTIRGAQAKNEQPHNPLYTGGAQRVPSASESQNISSDQLQVNLTQLLSSRALNEVKVGYAGFYYTQEPTGHWSDSPDGHGTGTPLIRLKGGLLIGQAHTLSPERIGQDVYSVRDDFTYSFAKGGRHALKIGGEYLHYPQYVFFCNNCNPTIDATNGDIPANLVSLFPDINNADTWNLAPLSPITKTFLQGTGTFKYYNQREVGAAWVQDDWTVTPRLTLNLGLRYDVAKGLFAENTAVPPFLPAGRKAQKNRFQPRPGFAFTLDDKTVIRGGFGKFFGDVSDQPALWASGWSLQSHPQVLNDGRPDFAANPFNAPPGTPYSQAIPSFAQVQAKTCQATNGAPGCFRTAISSQLIRPDAQVPYSWQTSVGVQRQMSETMGVNADYVYEGQRHNVYNISNTNLNFNAATGLPLNYLVPANNPYPNFGIVAQIMTELASNYHALQTSLNKRFSQRWQASATYTMAFLKDSDPCPPTAPANVAPGFCGEYGYATTDQRHRAVFNGIWQLPYGIQLSGLYLFGSGQRFATTYGQDVLNSGQGVNARIRPNLTIVPRNNFVGKPIHRVDMRVQKKVRIIGRTSVDGIFELFNVFNHENYGAYVTSETAANNGAPSYVGNIAYVPRTAQLGFRVTF